MSLCPYPDGEYYHNAESFGEYLQTLKKNGNERKAKFAQKIFFDTYYECIQERMDSHNALQKAIKVAFCYLIEKE
jgi:hypothetical protein